MTDTMHTTIYREAGRCGGWPANNGAWQWGDELLVGFNSAEHRVKPVKCHQVRQTGQWSMLARSLDGGETWSVDRAAQLENRDATELVEPMDFACPDFAMTLRMTSHQTGPSVLFCSHDRGRNWTGPWKFPTFGETGIMARTDYLLLGPRRAIVFLTAPKRDGREGRPLCAITDDGGLTWNLRGWIGDEPGYFRIMPSSLRLADGRLLTAVRDKRGPPGSRISFYESRDEGRIWSSAGHLMLDDSEFSTPPDLLHLPDGRLCVVFGDRREPYNLRATFAEDIPSDWPQRRVLRGGAACWDFGYSRSFVRSDGMVVSVYYWCETEHGERTIEGTIWNPSELAMEET